MTQNERQWILKGMQQLMGFVDTRDPDLFGKAVACFMNALPADDATVMHRIFPTNFQDWSIENERQDS